MAAGSHRQPHSHAAHLLLPPQSNFRSPEHAATESSLRAQLEQAQRELSNSESHVRILEHKADTAAKAAKQAAAQAQREKAALQKQVRGLLCEPCRQATCTCFIVLLLQALAWFAL